MWHCPVTMVDLVPALRARVTAAGRVTGGVRPACGAEAASPAPAVPRSDHADYQADVALALARPLKRSPRDVAPALLAHLPADDVVAEAEVSGPGFINLTLRAEHLGRALDHMLADERLAVPAASPPETVVVDYSAPTLPQQTHA